MFAPKSLWDFDDPKGSQLRFENALKTTDEPTDQAIIKSQIVRALGLQQEWVEALAVLTGIGATEDFAATAWVEIEHGRLLRSSGNVIEAREHFEYAAEAAKMAGLEALYIDALHMIALTLEGQEQIDFTKRAIVEAKSSSAQEARDWTASLLNNLGMSYTDAGDWDAARKCFDDALAERVRIGDDNRTFPARYMVGWAMRKQGYQAEALAWMTQLQTDLLAAGRSDKYVVAELEKLRS